VSDADTRDALSSEEPTRTDRRVFVACLTILFHHDPARVGERALVPRQERGRSLKLSRTDLEFTPPGGGEPRALEDPFISRTPIELTASSDGSVTIDAPERTGVKIDGAPATKVKLELGRLERGVVIELAKRAVLWLSLAEIGPRPDDHAMTGDSAAIRGVQRAVTRVADLDLPVLIRGETGVGKERVAQAIHAASGRRGPLIAVNVSTLPPTLASSELFGHAKGAFTGANERRVGLFERADGGTLFLDEIGEIADDVQPMLLRVLETGTLSAIGEREEKTVSVRVISATDVDLEARVHEGRFRAALYHRLRGFEITVPPLRERREDVARLLVMFLRQELAKTDELHRLTPDPDAPPWIDRKLVIRLVAHDWPGNVRQLQGIVRQLVVASRGQKTLAPDAAIERALAAASTALAAAASPSPAERGRGGYGGLTPPTPISAVDIPRDEVIAALEKHRWSFGKAARALGITRSALYRRTENDPDIKNANDLDRRSLEAKLAENGGDLDRTAASLRISTRALKLRLRALGMEP
jgi:two-component system nitrogen regulation response regulator GlnG